MNVISFNTAGIISPEKVNLVWGIFNDLKDDIILIQEVHKEPKCYPPNFDIVENFSETNLGRAICTKKGSTTSNCR